MAGAPDPRDVAAYCAFAWHHGWSIAPAQPAQGDSLTDSPSAPQLIAPTDVLTRKLALSLYETWTFAWLWADGQARDRGGKMHRVHAAMLARLHDAMTSAHAAGYLLGDSTTRLPGLLAEHGFDVKELLQEAAPAETKEPSHG